MDDHPMRRRSDNLPRHIASTADNRMRTRTAKEQLADEINALRGPDEIPLPDADDASMKRPD